MGNKLPLQKPREVQANIKALGFKYKRTDGSHETWERVADAIITERKVVTVDVGKEQFDQFLMLSMIRQSGFKRDEFCSGRINKSRTANIPAPKVSVNKAAVPISKTPQSDSQSVPIQVAVPDTVVKKSK